MTGPSSTPRGEHPGRHTADTITDDALDALYEERDRWRQRAEKRAARYEEVEAADQRVRDLADELANSRHRGQHGIPHPVVARMLRDALDGEQAPAAELAAVSVSACIEQNVTGSLPRQQYRTRGNTVEFRAVPPADEPAGCPTPETHNWGCGCPTDVSALRMELNAQRQRADQAEDLLRVAHETSNRSEAERARAVQRAERAEEQRDRLITAARDVLHICGDHGSDVQDILKAALTDIGQPATEEQPDAR